MFLLDTNVISELRSGKPKSAGLVRVWAASTPIEFQYLFAVTIGELETGILTMERRDIAQGRMLRAWFGGVRREFEGRVLPFGELTALLYAGLHIPNRRPERDAMIAATAKEHGFTVVTRNTRDFEDCGVTVFNPWI